MSDTVTIDNSANGDMKRVITWQFDNASKLRDTIYIFRDFFNASIKNVADKVESVVNFADVETADDYALSIWGRLLGVDRPTVLVNGVETPLLTEAYRKLLVARFRLLNSDASAVAYGDFLTALFGNSVQITQDGGMALKFSYTGTAPSEGNTEEYHLYRLFIDKPDAIFVYPAGVKDDTKSDGPVFGFDGQFVYMENGVPAVKQNYAAADVVIHNTSYTGTRVEITATVNLPSGLNSQYRLLYLRIVDNVYRATTIPLSSGGNTYQLKFVGENAPDAAVGSNWYVYIDTASGEHSAITYGGNYAIATINAVSTSRVEERDITIPFHAFVNQLVSSTPERRLYTTKKIVALSSLDSQTIHLVSNYATNNTGAWLMPPRAVAVLGEDGTTVNVIEDIVVDWTRTEPNAAIETTPEETYSPLAELSHYEGDFAVVNFDHGCFAWKRDIAQINQEQL